MDFQRFLWIFMDSYEFSGILWIFTHFYELHRFLWISFQESPLQNPQVNGHLGKLSYTVNNYSAGLTMAQCDEKSGPAERFFLRWD